MTLLLRNVRIVDEATDRTGAVRIENGLIGALSPEPGPDGADLVLDGGGLTLMPAFVDLHAHFREPGNPEKETLEAASLAAAAGGFGTVVCMANTRPVIDSAAAALGLRRRTAALGLIDLYPVLCLTRGMDGRDSSHLDEAAGVIGDAVRLLSEDGRDVADEGVFAEALARAARRGVPVSCHCDQGGEDAATRRAIALGRTAGARLHLAHVSTIGALEALRAARRDGAALTAEATPHHLGLTAADARELGKESFGRVNPPLRGEADRQALIAALRDGTIDAIATDHAPHTQADKAAGAPGFSGLETAFAVAYTTLVRQEGFSLSRLSALLSAAPARILGLRDRGRVEPGLRADLVLVDPDVEWTVDPGAFRSRGQNSPWAGRRLGGRVRLTIHAGNIVYQRSLP